MSVFDEAPENLSVSSLVIEPIPNQALVESKFESVPLSKPERDQISDALAVTQDEAVARALQLAAFKESVLCDMAAD